MYISSFASNCTITSTSLNTRHLCTPPPTPTQLTTTKANLPFPNNYFPIATSRANHRYVATCPFQPPLGQSWRKSTNKQFTQNRLINFPQPFVFSRWRAARGTRHRRWRGEHAALLGKLRQRGPEAPQEPAGRVVPNRIANMQLIGSGKEKFLCVVLTRNNQAKQTLGMFLGSVWKVVA